MPFTSVHFANINKTSHKAKGNKCDICVGTYTIEYTDVPNQHLAEEQTDCSTQLCMLTLAELGILLEFQLKMFSFKNAPMPNNTCMCSWYLYQWGHTADITISPFSFKNIPELLKLMDFSVNSESITILLQS